MHKEVTTPRAPAPVGPYSQGVVVGSLLFSAGQGPFTKNGELVNSSFQQQVNQTFDNLEAIAKAAGSSLAKMVSLRVYLSTLNFFEEFNKIAAQRLTKPYPVRTTIPVSLRGFDIEMDAVFAV